MSSSPSPKKPKRAKRLNTVGLMEYLQTSLPRETLLELYEDELRGRFVCRAVLQRLPASHQQVVVRLACCGGSFPVAALHTWLKTSKTPAEQQQRFLAELYPWAIVESAKAGDGSISLTEPFCKGLRDALHSVDASPWIPLTPAKMELIEQEASKVNGKPARFPAQTPEDLERHAQAQWDAVLHFLCGNTDPRYKPNDAITHFLLQTDLMQPDPEYKGNVDDADLVITQKGYDFMLQDSSQQVWHFVVQYLQSISQHSQALKKEALMVLLCLSFARFGECYSGSALSKDGRGIIKDLALFGLLYVKKIGKTSIFYPTRLAMQLVGNDGPSGGGGGGGMWSLSSKALESALANPSPSDSSHLAVIVQTNFQLCAYTTSELHVSMLGLFCEVGTIRRLPNCVFMSLTRDSVKAAFALGIQAQQILRFLEKHAHPRLRQGTASPVPPNIVDQIFLWDRERHRVQWNEVFSHQCMLEGEFQAVKKYAESFNAHVWSSEGRNQLFLKYELAESMQTFVRKWRAKTASRQD